MSSDSYQSETDAKGRDLPVLHFLLTVGIVLVFAYALRSPYQAGWPRTTRMFPVAVGWVGLVASVVVLLGQVRTIRRHLRTRTDGSWPRLGPSGPPLLPVVRHWAWMVGYVVTIFQVGFLPATFLFIVLYVLVEARRGLRVALTYALVMIPGMMFIFGTLFGLPWPRGRFNGLQRALLEFYWSIGG